MEQDLISAGYDAVYAAMPNSPTARRIWHELAEGPDFPEEFGHLSFTALPEPQRMAAELRVGPRDTFVDVGCGTGGPAVSGREADDAYTPRESLAAIGAEIAFAGDVERILIGDGTGWDRIGIVRCRRRAKEVAPNVSKALYSSCAALLDAGVVSWEGVAG